MSGNDEEEYNIINGEIPAPKPKESYYKHKKGYKLQQTSTKRKVGRLRRCIL